MRALLGPRRFGSGERAVYRADSEPVDDDLAVHPPLVAPASGSDAWAPAAFGPGCGGTYMVIRAQAVQPTTTAPTTPNASR